jgi:hypothetical protein
VQQNLFSHCVRIAAWVGVLALLVADSAVFCPEYPPFEESGMYTSDCLGGGSGSVKITFAGEPEGSRVEDPEEFNYIFESTGNLTLELAQVHWDVGPCQNGEPDVQPARLQGFSLDLVGPADERLLCNIWETEGRETQTVLCAELYSSEPCTLTLTRVQR